MTGAVHRVYKLRTISHDEEHHHKSQSSSIPTPPLLKLALYEQQKPTVLPHNQIYIANRLSCLCHPHNNIVTGIRKIRLRISLFISSLSS